ncbi:unnamed protein product, partial [Ectocarpus fasciculatus]
VLRGVGGVRVRGRPRRRGGDRDRDLPPQIGNPSGVHRGPSGGSRARPGGPRLGSAVGAKGVATQGGGGVFFFVIGEGRGLWHGGRRRLRQAGVVVESVLKQAWP